MKDRIYGISESFSRGLEWRFREGADDTEETQSVFEGDRL